MDSKARRAWSIIRRCVEQGRYRVLEHFTQRMDQRGLVWPDVLAVVDDPAGVRPGGPEEFGRPKWIINGTAADGLEVEIVCVLDHDEQGRLTVFITIY
jgi:hypothetical protein